MIDKERLALFNQAKSISNDTAVKAVHKIRQKGWWDDFLTHQKGTMYKIELPSVRWSNVKLDNVNLHNANLWDAKLEKADLRFAGLQEARLEDAHLQGSDLRSAHLQGAVLVKANLQDVHLNNAELQGANLMGANLRGADLQGAKFDEKTVLPDAQIVGMDNNRKAIYDKYWTPDIDEEYMSRYTHQIS